MTAPIRLAALAATYALAWRATGNAAWLRQYDRIRKQNIGTICRTETHVLWVHPWYQDVIAYMVLAILTWADGGAYACDYERALENQWVKNRHEGNTFYAYLRYAVTGRLSAEDARGALITLREFNADRRLGPTAKDKGAARGGGETDPFTWGWRWAKGGHRLSRQPVPVWRRVPQDFVWQRCPYSIGGEEHADFNGLDFCVAYWLGIKTGALK